MSWQADLELKQMEKDNQAALWQLWLHHNHWTYTERFELRDPPTLYAQQVTKDTTLWSDYGPYEVKAGDFLYLVPGEGAKLTHVPYEAFMAKWKHVGSDRPPLKPENTDAR